MGEDRAWPGEPAGWYGQGQLGHGFLFQGPHQDAFDPAHVDEVHVQGPAAGVVQTLRCVALSQADQLVSLPDLGPALFQKSYSQAIFGTTGDSVPKVAGLRNTGSIPNS